MEGGFVIWCFMYGTFNVLKITSFQASSVP